MVRRDTSPGLPRSSSKSIALPVRTVHPAAPSFPDRPPRRNGAPALPSDPVELALDDPGPAGRHTPRDGCIPQFRPTSTDNPRTRWRGRPPISIENEARKRMLQHGPRPKKAVDRHNEQPEIRRPLHSDEPAGPSATPLLLPESSPNPSSALPTSARNSADLIVSVVGTGKRPDRSPR